jgi:uncharacterized protein YprB with RNaseH-like and TPR domain
MFLANGRLKALRPAPRRDASPSAATNPVSPRGYLPDIPEGAHQLAEILDAQIRSNRFGEHLALRKWYSEPVTDAPGLGAPDGTLDVAALQLLAPGAAQEIADPRRWLFLDTETTGITGGTGTYPFLVGIAWWDAGGLEVEQLFMRDYSDEHSLLGALAERITERPVLVTFNGKSFDWPLLETRYRMTRTMRTPALRAHLDFLHPARNLWRLRIGSVRLAELELKVLGWNRGSDIASSTIPQTYFDFLRGAPPEPLLPIFHHNQMDLRGLAALAGRVLSLLENPETHGHDGLELFGVSRICERRGDAARARKHYAQSIARDLPVETERAARSSLARLAKRDGDIALALQLWEGMLGSSREGLEAYEQLAIYYEHRAREPQRAAALAKEALLELRNANRLGAIASTYYRERRLRFEQRLARLERTSARGLLGPIELASPEDPAESNLDRTKGEKFRARVG